MKRTLHKPLWLCPIVLLTLLSPLATITQSVRAQAAHQWPTRLQANSTPADITLTSISGQSTDVASGVVVGIGDFNGDRISDFLVSYSKFLPDSDGSFSEHAVRYGIFFGKPNPFASFSINIDSQTPDLTLDLDYKTIGFISTVGDINGDRIDDLMLIERVGDFGLGSVRILFGSPRLQPGHLDVTRQTPDIRILNPHSRFDPISVRIADLNGDGVQDLILANDPFSASRIYGLFGPFNSGSTIDLDSPTAGLIITDNSRNGAQLLAPADVNGDGKADILLGRSGPAPAQGFGPLQLHIVFGAAATSSPRMVSLDDGQADATFEAGFITGPWRAGDINGDGSADLLIGRTARFDSGPPLTSGWIDVIFGSPTLRGRIEHTDAKISGLPTSSAFGATTQAGLVNHLGSSVIVRDFNGDGFDDMVIGAVSLQGGPTQDPLLPGRTHIIFGSANIADVSIEKEQQDVSIIFGKRQRYSGSPVNVGDFNGDGIPDVLIGGLDVMVYFGAPLRPPQVTQAKYRSDAEDLIISGTDFTGAARVEINGTVIDREVVFLPEQNQLVVHGSKARLNLQDGMNEVVVLRKGARSNAGKIKVKG